ncbi:MAG: LysE family transporter [Sphingomonadales bacterium]
MNWLYIPIGMIIGVVVAAPIGAVNLIAINRTMKHGLLHGVLAGCGAALGDGVFAAFASFGLTTFSELVIAQQDPLRLVGGAILLGFAYFVWRAKPKLDKVKTAPDDTPHLMVAVFMLTITNPATLMGFTAIFAAWGFKDIGTRNAEFLANGGLLVAGVMLGSVLWWLTLCYAVSHLRQRITQQTFVAINHGSAVLLFLFGIAAIVAGLMD